MITCTFEDGRVSSLRHVVVHAIVEKEDRQNIAFDFLVRPIRKTGNQDTESSKVEWIPIEKLLSFDQFAFDHGDSIKLYLEYRKKPFLLPLFA